MIFNVIHELISDMTIHITTYDTCVYVDKSVDFVDYLWFYTEKTTDGSKMVYNSKRTVVDKKNKTVLDQSMKGMVTNMWAYESVFYQIYPIDRKSVV